MKIPLIAPSFLSADFANLQKDCEMINNSDADWFHLDIMDGAFVPNISFGFPVIEAIRKHTDKPLDVHLMIQHPEMYLEEFKKAGADWLSVHYEASPHLHRTIGAIKELGMKAGVVLNPHTPVSVLEEIICDVDYVLLMSVNPGFGGQKFIASTIEKTKKMKAMIHQSQSNALIEIDGGVTNENARLLCEAGADVLVAGSFIFKASSPQQTIKELKNICNNK